MNFIENYLENKPLELIILMGNIGSGKSVHAKALADYGYIIVNADSLHQSMSGGLYVYNEKFKTIYWEVENFLIETALKNGISVVVDRTNVDLKRRKRFVRIGKKYNAEIVVIDWGVGNKEVNIERRMYDPRGISRERWEKVFDKMAADYVAPSKDEGIDEIIKMGDYWNNEIRS